MIKKITVLTPTGDCLSCGYKKGMNNPFKGKKIGYPPGGKCTRPGGFCEEKGALGEAPETNSLSSPEPSNEVELSLIYPNPDQPRKVFPREGLEELAQSIREHGLIEPLVVVERPLKGTAKVFMLVAGERRWRACQLIGLALVPVRIIKADDQQIAEMALVENIQRQDLTPLEEARAFKKMLDDGYTKESLSQKLGFKQTWRIDDRLSLLNLAPRFQEALLHGAISPSQAFEMSRLKDAGDQEQVFDRIKAGKLPTYNHLRRFVNAMLEAKKERFLFALPKKEDLEIIGRWQRTLDSVSGLVMKSFSPDDCRVLATVMNGNTAVNIEKIDLIIKHLNLMKKAMLENLSRQEVSGIIQFKEAVNEGNS